MYKEFFGKMFSIMNEVLETQGEAIRKGSEMMAEAIARKSNIYAFGAGHAGILAQERSKYYKAIRASQSPENGYDFTYFLEYYAAMLEKSVEGIHEHMMKFRRVQQLAEQLGHAKEYGRILEGAKWMVNENIPTITTEKWCSKFKVSFETARQDLMKLEAEGFLIKRTVGRKNFFDIVADETLSH